MISHSETPQQAVIQEVGVLDGGFRGVEAEKGGVAFRWEQAADGLDLTPRRACRRRTRSSWPLSGSRGLATRKPAPDPGLRLLLPCRLVAGDPASMAGI